MGTAKGQAILKTNGFTLIELVITLVVVGIMGAFAIALWPDDTINISAQADQVASDILYTQFLSITTGQRYRFVRTSTTTYQIQNSAGTAVTYLGTGGTTITLDPGLTFGSFTNLPNNLIVFDGEGTPYTTTAVPGTKLTAQATILLNGTSGSRSILVSPTTGWVEVQ